MSLMENFETNLKIIMKEKGYSQSDLAKKAGIGISTVSDWLRKHKEPTLSSIYKITKVLDCTFEELVD